MTNTRSRPASIVEFTLFSIIESDFSKKEVVFDSSEEIKLASKKGMKISMKINAQKKERNEKGAD